MLKITLIALGSKMPAWVEEATQEYMKRFKEAVQIKIIEIPLIKRGKTADLSRILEKEAALIKANLPSNAYLIALDLKGQAFSSEALAQKIEQLQQQQSHFCFIIGGPEGLAKEVLSACHTSWSLSPLTLPHPLVRIFLLETLYRSWSILHNHPYHK